MESEKQSTESERQPLHWRSCKLVIDPVLTNGLYKVYRYDGQYFNLPVEDLGLLPVITVRDPRICRLWSRCIKTDFVVPKFKIDEWHVAPVPPKEVTFSNLNDNVNETFLTDMCKRYGNMEEVEIFYNPKNKKHLGIAKVTFDTVKAAREAVQHLHGTSVMGNIIHVELDLKGENRARYLQLLLSGMYTPWTLPVGSGERALQDLVDSLLGSSATQQLGSVCSPTSIATPLSLDTAYSSICQDTPCSFGLTPHSQGTPRTPCLPATPLSSHDSCYSSLQATPVLQGEPSAYSVHKPLRQELSRRRRRHRGLSHVSNVSIILKQFQPQPTHPLLTKRQTSSQQLTLWSPSAQTSSNNNDEAPFNLTSPFQETENAANTSYASSHLNSNSRNILSVDLSADLQTTTTSPFHNHQPEAAVSSLDSRIESLLINSQITDPLCFDGKTLETDPSSQDSPASPGSPLKVSSSDDSQFCTPLSCESPTSGHQYSHNDAVDENEDDETTRAVSFLTRSSQSPCLSDVAYSESITHINNEEDAERVQPSSCPKKSSNKKQFEAVTPAEDISLPNPPSGCSSSSIAQLLTPKALPTVAAGFSQPPAPPFLFPIPRFPPSLPPVPPRLPNGTIPIPPPGWMPPLGHKAAIPIPPPPIPPPTPILPPPTFLRPPPPLIVPPSVPPPVHMFPLPIQLGCPLDKGNPPRHGGAPLSFPPPPPPPPPWPAPPFPRFNPFVPPPLYPPVQVNPHKVTTEKVLDILMDELKSIIKKDITRRMIEGVAFKAFEDWWECQEKKAKIQESPLKCGAARVEERNKFLNPLSNIGERGRKPPLPSFKVKRKRSDETGNHSGSALDHSEVKKRNDIVRKMSERAKRRHARPLDLDSDDNDDDGDAEKEEAIPDKVKVFVLDEDEPHILSDRDAQGDDEDDDDGGNHTEEENRPMEDQCDREQCLDSEVFSEESERTSDSDTSDSLSSVGFEDTSSDLTTEAEDTEEESEDAGSEECIVISSDEDSVELGPPLTPSAPLTPGAQLDLDQQGWSELFPRRQTEEDQYTSCHEDNSEFVAMMELYTSEPQDPLPPSPLGISAVEPSLDMEMESPDWTRESPENIKSPRPPTPSGRLVDSDSDILFKSRPSSPAAEEEERPPTPGKGIVAGLESENSEEVLSLSPASGGLAQPPADLFMASHPLWHEMPKTPGRDEKGVWTHYVSGRAPATPGRGIADLEFSTVSPPLRSPPPIPLFPNSPYITAPKTPGRDIILPRRSIVHKRKSQLAAMSIPLSCNNIFRVSPITTSSSFSVSESSCESTDGSEVQIRSGVRAKPLQGLENMPELLDKEKIFLRLKRWRRLKKRRRAHHWERSLKRVSPLSSHRRPHRWRSPYEERKILRSIWKDGLDEEDARFLQCTYERLQAQDNGCGWLSDTLWMPHPLTKVHTENEEHRSWQLHHRTGSARSEGFYKISRKDKMRYLHNTRLAMELPSTSAQGTCIPTQQHTSLRAGSDFRCEQRRLLSSFSCDSDLVKFNQLKFRRKRIRFSRSYIHEWGLFAMEPIAADEMVIEYVGQIIRQVIADMREQRYEEEGIGSSYLFRVDQDTIIDATKCGNLARFINHSCNPNCYAKIITVESQKKIVIYSRQPININEEITYDYKFPIEETKIPCLCGADGCRGSLN